MKKFSLAWDFTDVMRFLKVWFVTMSLMLLLIIGYDPAVRDMLANLWVLVTILAVLMVYAPGRSRKFTRMTYLEVDSIDQMEAGLREFIEELRRDFPNGIDVLQAVEHEQAEQAEQVEEIKDDE